MKATAIIMVGFIIGGASVAYISWANLTGNVIPCFEDGMANGTFLPGQCSMSMSAPAALLVGFGVVLYGTSKMEEEAMVDE